MSLEQLRNDLEVLAGYTLIPVLKDAGQGLSNASPARVMPGEDQYCIEILNTLSPTERTEAEAHELAHIMIEHQGLVALDPNAVSPRDPWEWDYLSSQITQAISHRFVVELLAARYDISSDLHLRLRETSLDDAPEQDADSDDYSAQLHGFGVYLYDLEKTVPGILPRIEHVSHCHEAVAQSLSIEWQCLDEITLDMCRDDQLHIIHAFLSNLGYDPQRFPAIPPR